MSNTLYPSQRHIATECAERPALPVLIVTGAVHTHTAVKAGLAPGQAADMT